MKTQPITERCRNNFEKRIHACFGISPFNSYFSEDRIRALAKWGSDNFASMHFFVPDVPSVYTLQAMGYPPEKAESKARSQGRYTQNKIHRALKSLCFTDLQAWEMVLNWEALTENETYLRTYQDVTRLFESDSAFKARCVEASRWVLEKKVPDLSAVTSNTLEVAVKYLLTEIPLFSDSAGIVSKEASVFCYHQSIPFIDDLFRGSLPLNVSDRQGFVVLEEAFGAAVNLPVNESPIDQAQVQV